LLLRDLPVETVMNAYFSCDKNFDKATEFLGIA
jgi:hypothetical protein